MGWSGVVAASDPIIVTLAPYLVAGISVAGSAVTVAMTNRQGHVGWLRENRLRAVSSTLRAGTQTWAASRELDAAPQADRAEREREVEVALDALVLANAEVQLLGPKRLADVVDEWTELMGQVGENAIGGIATDEELLRRGVAVEERVHEVARTVFGRWRGR